MKNVLYLLIVLFIASCSAKKDFVSGRYDLAIQKSVKKLRKKPSNMKHMDILQQAFTIAQQRDLDRIQYLKKEGAPENWDEVFVTYSKIDQRQRLVKTLSQIPMGIKLINVDDEMITAKKNAAEFLYANSERLLKNNNRTDARKAFYQLQKVKSYFTNYRDVDNLLTQAKHLGTTYVFFKMENVSRILIPQDFERELLKMSLTGLNREWTQYHTTALKDLNYDYQILYKITMIDVSPEMVKETQYTDKMSIEDGWEYVLDSRGNVMKDSLGNDIKVKKYKEITCNVIQTEQRKTARISGVLEFHDLNSRQLLKSDPVTADAIFENIGAVAVGDNRALSAASKEKIKNRPVPFPPTPDLIMMGSNTVKSMISDIINRHRGLLN